MTALCVAPRCFVPGWHTDRCDNQKCHGCLPAKADHGLVCHRCGDRAHGALAEIPNLYALLDLQPGRGEPAPLGRAEAESRPPVRVDVLSELGPGALNVADPHNDREGALPAAVQLDRLVRDWASRTGEDSRLPLPTVPELCRWLAARLDLVTHHPRIAQAISEILDVRGRLRPLVNGIDLADWAGSMPGRCPACDRLTLTVDRGMAECHHPTCQRVWIDETEPEVDQIVHVPPRPERPTVEADGPVDLCELTELPISMCAHCVIAVA